MCDLPRETGPCLAVLPRWYFNGSSGLCERFTYGGCRGNRNNFVTLRSCLQTCARGNGIVIIIEVNIHLIFRFKGSKLCDKNVTTVECFSDPCATTHCPNFDDALCIPNHCGECSAHYYNSTGHDVTMMCSK